jgi:hypothetical protein
LRPGRELLTVPLAADREIELIAQKGHAWEVFPIQSLGPFLKNAAIHRVAVDVSGRSPMPTATPPAKEQQISDTGELCWRLPAPGRGSLELRGARTKAVVGHVDQKRVDLGHGVRVTVGQTRTGWCTVALALLAGDSFDGHPRRALLAAAGVTENSDMGWRDAKHDTVGQNWGRPPSLVEPIAAKIQIPCGAATPVVYPLDDRGQRGKAIPLAPAGTTAEFQIDSSQKTIWYEIDYSGEK